MRSSSADEGPAIRTYGRLLRLLRPHEWVKNVIIFAPLIFSGQLTAAAQFWQACQAFAVFCAAASAIYVLNDVLDRDRDALHPVKRSRPIPAGHVAPRDAVVLAIVLVVAAQLAFAQSRLLGVIVNTYLLSSLAYTFYLKRKVIIDVLTIAAGFVLRVLAGAAAIQVVPSEWIILCTFLLATFLGFSKRRHELIQLGPRAKQHRWVLTLYSETFLDQMNLVTITLTLTCYIFYTIAPETVARHGTHHLLYSVVLVMVGLFRYLFIIHHRQGGSPTQALYSDRQIVLIILLWLLYMVWCLYVWPSLI